jgi:septal ring factor EnvC (AmiA/AmiB activator)
MLKSKPSITALDKKIAKLQQLRVKREEEIKVERKPLEASITKLEGEIKSLEDKIAPTTKLISEKQEELAKVRAELNDLTGEGNPEPSKDGERQRLTEDEKADVEKLFNAKVKSGAKKGKAMKDARAEVLAKRS